jgi:hypothetical protein
VFDDNLVTSGIRIINPGTGTPFNADKFETVVMVEFEPVIVDAIIALNADRDSDQLTQLCTRAADDPVITGSAAGAERFSRRRRSAGISARG